MEIFYAHVNSENSDIIRVSREKSDSCIEIDAVLAIKFISGEENLHNWFINQKSKTPNLSKTETKKVSLTTLILVEPKTVDNPHISIIFNSKAKTFKIQIDEKLLNEIKSPISLFLTKKDDPTFLKQTIDIKSKISILKFDKTIKTDNDTSIFHLDLPIDINYSIK